MANQTGHLWAIIEEWMDSRGPGVRASQRELARAVGVSHSTITDWKYARSLPKVPDLKQLAAVLQVPYERVLNATLIDHGYREPPAPPTTPPGESRSA